MPVYVRRHPNGFTVEYDGQIVALHADFRAAEEHAHELARAHHGGIMLMLG